MIRVAPVGAAPAIGEQPTRSPDGRHPSTTHHGEAESFHASLLGQHAQQLDPDDHAGAEADLAQLEAALQHLLQMLEERLGNMQQRALLSAGHPSHGLLQELWQVDAVLQRLLPLWRHPLLSPLHVHAAPRLAVIFGICRFVLQAVVHAGEPHDWHALQQALQQHEAQLR